MKEKYIDLLVNKCLNFSKSNSLFISCDKVNKDFVNELIEKVDKEKVSDIYIDMNDIFQKHDKLKSMSLDEIEHDKYFDKSLWDEYAKKDAVFLMIDTEFPHVMDDIEPEKITKAAEIARKSRPIFRRKESTMEISWCIAAVANEIWAKDIFKDDSNAYQKLEELIYKCCMVDQENPIESWNNYLKKSEELADKLNNLKIESLHYKNSLGTDLNIELPKDVIWQSAASEANFDCIVNMPTYEIFTSPNYKGTNGIVYNALPLMYGGKLVDKFSIKFKDGKAISYKAEIGEEILKGIIEGDERSSYLGEVALVNHNSPISNTGVIFGTTLFDENASCHLALGDGFPECIKDGSKMSKEELLNNGINQCPNHVDFMVGTSDLEIEAKTKDGIIKIFENGNFVI